MDVHHIWCDLAEGARDVELVADLRRCPEHLRAEGTVRGHRITRAEPGLRPPGLRELHVMVGFDDLARVQAARDTVATRADPVEGPRHAVDSKVRDPLLALYRALPDPVRREGEERLRAQ